MVVRGCVGCRLRNQTRVRKHPYFLSVCSPYPQGNDPNVHCSAQNHDLFNGCTFLCPWWNSISLGRITFSPRTTISATMSKAVEHPLPLHTQAPTSHTAKRNRRFWLIAVFVGMTIFTTSFRSALKTTSWKPHIGCGKEQLHTTPRSHYTLPSGDKIPSVALGEPAP